MKEILGSLVFGAGFVAASIGIHYDIFWLILVGMVVFGFGLDMQTDAKIEAAKRELRSERE